MVEFLNRLYHQASNEFTKGLVVIDAASRRRGFGLVGIS